MQLEVKIKKEHLDGASYDSNTDCPLARALKALGYRKVGVGGTHGYISKGRKDYTFDIVSRFLSSTVENAQKKGNKPFSVTLNVEEL